MISYHIISYHVILYYIILYYIILFYIIYVWPFFMPSVQPKSAAPFAELKCLQSGVTVRWRHKKVIHTSVMQWLPKTSHKRSSWPRINSVFNCQREWLPRVISSWEFNAKNLGLKTFEQVFPKLACVCDLWSCAHGPYIGTLTGDFYPDGFFQIGSLGSLKWVAGFSYTGCISYISWPIILPFGFDPKRGTRNFTVTFSPLHVQFWGHPQFLAIVKSCSSIMLNPPIVTNFHRQFPIVAYLNPTIFIGNCMFSHFFQRSFTFS